ncbi:RICIN domain-containing protein [Streptomyces europaeiscabiei]|uniref:RICIN domain-containing protein n=1 Tax=Streptomyces europaeiscabiei TaxID=146819 RepID=UPI0038669105
MEVAGLSRVDGGDVVTWSDDDVPQQHWAVTPTGDGYHHLTNRLGGLSSPSTVAPPPTVPTSSRRRTGRRTGSSADHRRVADRC